MAKPKTKLIIQVIKGAGPTANYEMIRIYCDNLKAALSDISSIEGLQYITLLNGCIDAWVNPRYDANELVSEIKELLEAEIPDVFRE